MAKLLDGPTTLIFQSPPGIEGLSGRPSGGVIAVEVPPDSGQFGELFQTHSAHGHGLPMCFDIFLGWYDVAQGAAAETSLAPSGYSCSLSLVDHHAAQSDFRSGQGESFSPISRLRTPD
jgi:hypothetical protein